MEKTREISENIAVSLIWDICGRLLLIFKERENPDESVWMLPGGHSEPSNDKDLQTTAERENIEETSLLGIAGYKFLFYLEDDSFKNQRVFFVYEGFYLDMTKRINLPKELLKKEGIKKAKWFYPHEIEKLPLSPTASKIIGKVLLPKDQQTSFFNRSVNKLQSILNDARKNVDNNKMEMLVGKIKDVADFLEQFYDEKDDFLIKPVNQIKKDLVVVVEDDINVSNTTRDILEEYFRVVVFDNPVATLEWVRGTNQKIKAILVDYHFTTDEMTGVDLINKVNLLGKNIKAVLFTGYKVKDFDGIVLRKPSTSRELRSAICL